MDLTNFYTLTNIKFQSVKSNELDSFVAETFIITRKSEKNWIFESMPALHTKSTADLVK